MNTINGIDHSQIQAMLQQLRAAAAQTQAPGSFAASAASAASGAAPADSANGAAQAAKPVDFSQVLKSSLDKVAETQQSASDLSDRYMRGDDNVNLSEVMIAGQKANIALQTTIQVRTKLVAAYNDIMNMQV